MKGLKLSLLIISILVLSPFPIGATGLSGGRGLMHVTSAWTLKPGYLTLYSHSRFFGKVGVHQIGTHKTATTFWDVQGSMTFNYGINKNIEVALAPVIYQDNHKSGPGYNIPDDLFLNFKFGSYGAKGSPICYGATIDFRFPTAKTHNLMFEPYSAGTFEWGITGLLTYARDPLYPEDALNLHLNLGYLNHNDVGVRFSEHRRDSTEAIGMSQELKYGLGMEVPTNQFDFALELYGNLFLKKPPETAYSLENFLYITPAISYKAYRWLSIEVAGDFLLTSSDHDETNYRYLIKWPDMPNYPTWRVNIGLRMILLPTTAYRVSEKDILMRKAENRRELFEQIIKEQRETESAEEELDRIKSERRKAERELDRLRRILEGEAKKSKEKKSNNKPITP